MLYNLPINLKKKSSMNILTRILSLLILLSTLPCLIKSEENTSKIQKNEITYSLNIKNQKILFLAMLGLISGYFGSSMIKKGLETPITLLTTPDIYCPYIYVFGNFQEIIGGISLLYVGYKLIANNIKQENNTQE